MKYKDLTPKRKTQLEEMVEAILEHVVYHSPIKPANPTEMMDAFLTILIDREHITKPVELLFCGISLDNYIKKDLAKKALGEVMEIIGKGKQMVAVKVGGNNEDCGNQLCPVHGMKPKEKRIEV